MNKRGGFGYLVLFFIGHYCKLIELDFNCKSSPLFKKSPVLNNQVAFIKELTSKMANERDLNEKDEISNGG